MHRARATLLAAAWAAGTGACARYPATPEEAYARFSAAVGARDARALWKAVDPKTRSAWMTIQRCHRESYDVVLSTYPEGDERRKALRRYQAGALADGAAAFFAQEMSAALNRLAPLSASGPRIDRTGEDAAEVVLPSGARVPLRRGTNGSWGFAGWLADAQDREGRAIHDLELLARASGADYERAATREAAARR